VGCWNQRNPSNGGSRNNKQTTNKKIIGCVILNVRLILTMRLKRKGFELLFFK
jgi:hypothetical protein